MKYECFTVVTYLYMNLVHFSNFLYRKYNTTYKYSMSGTSMDWWIELHGLSPSILQCSFRDAVTSHWSENGLQQLVDMELIFSDYPFLVETILYHPNGVTGKSMIFALFRKLHWYVHIASHLWHACEVELRAPCSDGGNPSKASETGPDPNRSSQTRDPTRVSHDVECRRVFIQEGNKRTKRHSCESCWKCKHNASWRWKVEDTSCSSLSMGGTSEGKQLASYWD